MAIVAYDEAVALSRAVGDRRLEAMLLTATGDARRSLGQIEKGARGLHDGPDPRARDARHEIQGGTAFGLALLAATAATCSRRTAGSRSAHLRRIDAHCRRRAELRGGRFSRRSRMPYEFHIDVLMGSDGRDSRRVRGRRARSQRAEARARAARNARRGAGRHPAGRRSGAARTRTAGRRATECHSRRLTRVLAARPAHLRSSRFEQELRALIVDAAKSKKGFDVEPGVRGATQPQPLTVDRFRGYSIRHAVARIRHRRTSQLCVGGHQWVAVVVRAPGAQQNRGARAARARLLTQSQRPDLQAQVRIRRSVESHVLGPVLPQLKSRRLAIRGRCALQYVPFAALPEPVRPQRRAPKRFPDRVA